MPRTRTGASTPLLAPDQIGKCRGELRVFFSRKAATSRWPPPPRAPRMETRRGAGVMHAPMPIKTRTKGTQTGNSASAFVSSAASARCHAARFADGTSSIRLASKASQRENSSNEPDPSNRKTAPACSPEPRRPVCDCSIRISYLPPCGDFRSSSSLDRDNGAYPGRKASRPPHARPPKYELLRSCL